MFARYNIRVEAEQANALAAVERYHDEKLAEVRARAEAKKNVVSMAEK